MRGALIKGGRVASSSHTRLASTARTTANAVLREVVTRSFPDIEFDAWPAPESKASRLTKSNAATAGTR